MKSTKPPSNSQLEHLLYLYEALLLPVCVSQDPYFVSQSRLDYRTLVQRSSPCCEGIQFLTKTLPKLGKAFDSALVNNVFCCPREFGRKDRRSGDNRSIPEFLWAYFNMVFDEDGVLRGDIPLFAIKHIRQVCFFGYKYELPYDSKVSERFIKTFIETDESLGDIRYSDDDATLLLASDIAYRVFRSIQPKNIVPKHGPGAVATGEKGEKKWQFTTLYDNLHQYYPYYQYFIAGGARELLDRLKWYRALKRVPSGTAKLVLVPKDSRGPRLISEEPLEYMFIQQPLGRLVMSHLERNPLTGGKINFSSQDINRELARIHSSPIFQNPSNTPEPVENLSSLTHWCTMRPWITNDSLTREYSLGTIHQYPLNPLYEIKMNSKSGTAQRFYRGPMATLDLKDASDRVSLDLVQRIFKNTPDFLRSILATRSTATLLPDGSVQTLRKFAPMGSALCFPVEAFVFWTLIVAAITLSRKRQLNFVMNSVFVYGDDIIVPVEFAELAIKTLEKYGLKVNLQKSCITGNFRESCGVEAFRGHDVSIVRLKKLWTGSNSDGDVLASYMSLYNRFNREGMYPDLAQRILAKVEKTYGKMPYGTYRSGYVCREVADPAEAEQLNRLFLRKSRIAYDGYCQTYQFRVLVVRPRRFESKLNGWPRLMRNLTGACGPDPSHYALPREIVISSIWSAAR